jgi:hypothetical protein
MMQETQVYLGFASQNLFDGTKTADEIFAPSTKLKLSRFNKLCQQILTFFVIFFSSFRQI